MLQCRADTPDHGGNGNPPFCHNGSSISGDPVEYLVYLLVLLVEQMDTYLGSVYKCSH